MRRNEEIMGMMRFRYGVLKTSKSPATTSAFASQHVHNGNSNGGRVTRLLITFFAIIGILRWERCPRWP